MSEHDDITAPRATPGAIAVDEGDRFDASERSERLREGFDAEKQRLADAEKGGAPIAEELRTRVHEAQLDLDAAEAFEDALNRPS